MSSEFEFQGKTLEKAVQAACKHLDIKEESLNYDILRKGSTGLFGLVGVKKAKIRVITQGNQDDRDKAPAIDPGDEESDIGGFSDAALCGKEALQKMVDVISAEARVTLSETGKRIKYEIEGGKAGVLIGKRGQTLDALQYLVEKIVNRKRRERVRVSIDVGDYLSNKKKNLENLAVRTALKAKKDGKPASIGQLNAHDRRIVHMALKDEGEVITKSVGNGFLRKLVVLPKKRRGSPRRRP